MSVDKSVLLLGGSWFFGVHLAEEAQEQGAEVTTFRRGISGRDVDGVRTVRGDKTNPDDLKRLAAHGPWDLVVDSIGFVPREVLAMARALEPVANRYVFISSVSAYEGWPTEPLTEASAVLECPADAGPDYGVDRDPGPTKYGFTKAGCERAVLQTFGTDRTTIIRPGVILGPHEYVGRLPWWLRRFERGGRVLAPGNPDRSIQPIDVRDVAAFALHCGTAAVSGTFNATGTGEATFGTFLRACADVTKSAAAVSWADEEFLVQQGVRQWEELPLWRTYAGAWDVDATNARAHGLVTRPLEETVRDTWQWLNTGHMIEHERAAELGIAPEREQQILRAWDDYRKSSPVPIES
ncbi:NAD-dependent epimerase [Lentzea aerocolonigenes]|uniref:NAD-dependent epimerase n=1 Tax=Lentzea aerocolonigenes TaxID=68170 RepID=A0A0F0GY40_LENAE|nr:NAD-dependent epimerase/dehydratase family protein [Lentzea aerocolonigenes]KJK46363.1 NAD-dependent epimerase [Lentzea aerocolonigenes]